jgi:hypothetical protein
VQGGVPESRRNCQRHPRPEAHRQDLFQRHNVGWVHTARIATLRRGAGQQGVIFPGPREPLCSLLHQGVLGGRQKVWFRQARRLRVVRRTDSMVSTIMQQSDGLQDVLITTFLFRRVGRTFLFTLLWSVLYRPS